MIVNFRKNMFTCNAFIIILNINKYFSNFLVLISNVNIQSYDPQKQK